MRKVVTILLLPIIIVVWMFGWILTQLGNPTEIIMVEEKENEYTRV